MRTAARSVASHIARAARRLRLRTLTKNHPDSFWTRVVFSGVPAPENHPSVSVKSASTLPPYRFVPRQVREDAYLT